ncbi:MAG: hypothetical protein J6S40_08255 [Thermoguttaceae bacterium]|nr:hypothetical protein [Thermoguttaceae bacterium]
MNRRCLTWFFLLVSLSAALFFCGGLLSAEQIETFQTAEGETFFAAPLTAPAEEIGPVDAVLAIDLSASQLSMQVRAEARRAAAAFISGLTEGSRVQVFVASNRLVPLPATAEFKEASPELAEKVAADLAKETPLGAMDMKEMLRAAVGRLRDLGPGRPRLIVFIGRGVSTASFFDRHEAALLTADLVKERITFSAFANGAVTNNNALASLVYRTGGALVDLRIKEGDQAGASLASSTAAAVYWLDQADPAAIGADALYPTDLPPVRSDRETFLIGSGNLVPGDEINLDLPARLFDGSKAAVRLTLKVGEPKEENRQLEAMVAEAAKDGGLALPIPGRALLREYLAALDSQNETMRKMGEQASANGQSDDAALLLRGRRETAAERQTESEKAARPEQ